MRDRGCVLRALRILGGSSLPEEAWATESGRLNRLTTAVGQRSEAFRTDEAHSSTWRTGGVTDTLGGPGIPELR